MGSSFCKYENRDKCVLVKKPCVPGQKGCILGTKVKEAELGTAADARGYKSRDIARFREK